MKPFSEALLLLSAIFIGSLTGLFTSFEYSQVDYSIIALLFFLFYNISLNGFLSGVQNRKYISIALFSNFVIIPTIAFLIASIFVDSTSAIFIGLIIYMVAPCTDWFLGFTKLANGDVEVNAALLPFNLLLQILLLPVYLFVFTNNSIEVPFDAFFDALIYWVVLPFVVAQVLRFIISKFDRPISELSSSLAEYGVLISLVILLFSIFNSNIESLIADTSVLPIILVVIVIFFVSNFLIVKLTSRIASFSKSEEVSLTMTTAARNAPLMLGISLVLFPQQTLIHLVLVIGMLLEIPLLVAITYMSKRIMTLETIRS
jgi:ACR3 family arsenite efflux pump ArsB